MEKDLEIKVDIKTNKNKKEKEKEKEGRTIPEARTRARTHGGTHAMRKDGHQGPKVQCDPLYNWNSAGGCHYSWADPAWNDDAQYKLYAKNEEYDD